MTSLFCHLVAKAKNFDNLNFGTYETDRPKLTQSRQNCPSCFRFKKVTVLFQLFWEMSALVRPEDKDGRAILGGNIQKGYGTLVQSRRLNDPV